MKPENWSSILLLKCTKLHPNTATLQCNCNTNTNSDAWTSEVEFLEITGVQNVHQKPTDNVLQKIVKNLSLTDIHLQQKKQYFTTGLTRNRSNHSLF